MIVPAPPGPPAPAPRPSPWLVLFGCAYLIFTTACGAYYLHLVAPSLQNDLWWCGFTTTGPHTFLGDLFHARLQRNASGATSALFAPEMVVSKTYDAGSTFIDMPLSLSRRVLLADTPFSTVVSVLRTSSFNTNVRMYAQYCYVDFSRRYEVSTTAARQARCETRYADNAAVYWEALLRNSVPSDMQSCAYIAALEVALFDTLNSTPHTAWWTETWIRPWQNVAAEVSRWEAAGMRRWQTQVNNYYEVGLTSGIVVLNALGLSETLTIHQVARNFRGLALWTMVSSYNGIWNDLWECQTLGCSLIRGANAFSDQVKLDWLNLEYGVTVNTPLLQLIDATMGPIGSIDITFVATPASLEAFADDYQRLVVGGLVSNAAQRHDFSKLTSITVTLTPLPWRGHNMSFFGGNPMCIYNTPQPFVQDQIGFYDACAEQTPWTMALTPASVLFAFVAMGGAADVRGICAHCDDAVACAAAVGGVVSWLHTTDLAIPDGSGAHASLEEMNLVAVQLALNDSRSVLLSHPWLSPDDSWCFFGWVAIHDWLRGAREVYHYESDGGSYTLLTQAVSPTPLSANALEVPRQASTYVWIILVFSSLVLATLAVLLLGVAVVSRPPVCWRDLFQFNRVAGATWVGRPFLLLRGVTALIVLSTSPVAFVSSDGFTRFIFAPRTLLETMVVAGEATWVTYVFVDVLLPITKRSARRYAPLSSFCAWIILVTWDAVAPYEAILSARENCQVLSLGLSATCTAGQVDIGSPSRFWALVAVNLLCVLFPALWLHNSKLFAQSEHNTLLPAASVAFLSALNSPASRIDATGAVMSGLLPHHKGYLDVSLWLWVHLRVGPRLQTKVAASSCPPALPRRLQLQAAAGFTYVVFSVVGSYSYIYVSETALANDFWWAGFNATAHGTYLANWFASQLQLSGSASAVSLTTAEYWDNTNAYNASTTLFSVSSLYATMVQDEVNSLPNVVAGLRTMDGCLAPWIATALCFADLNRTWEMAVSASRQAMCDAANGAVYLETLVRNVPDFESCWGEALNVGVYSVVAASDSGRRWVASLQEPWIAVADEVALWQQHGITGYGTQWQNYKSLGVLESFSIVSAFGVAYPITLRTSNGSLHARLQTSFKMQWPLAAQLWAVASNASVFGGRSLVRNTASFVFTNASTFAALAANGTLAIPLDAGLAAFQTTVGPYGDIGMKRVPFPPPLVAWYKATLKLILTNLAAANDSVAAAFAAVPATVSVFPMPSTWPPTGFVGGDITCPTQSTSVSFVLQFFSNAGVCAANNQDSITTGALAAAQALLAEGDQANVTASCALNWGSPATCADFLGQAAAYLEAQLAPSSRRGIAATSATAKEYLQTELPIVLVQYVHNASGTHLLQTSLFDAADGAFHLFGWLYLLDWLAGNREVVAFCGVRGSIVTLSARAPVRAGPLNGLEVPINVSYYARYVLVYITGVLFFVACLAGVYVLASRGRVHGLNMFAINRVTGLVWIGRPLLLLRGVTALCLLSTAALTLEQSRGFYFLAAPRPSWLATVMAAGETTWLVFILNDGFSLATKQYTAVYAAQSSILVWAVAALWSLVSPVQHSATVARACDVVAVDLQLVCHGGSVAIGSARRLVALAAMASGVAFATYVVQRCRFPALASREIHSHLLYASAQYHFVQTGWVDGDVYHLDRASAAIAGLLSVHWRRHKTLVLDIKSWRLHALDIKSWRLHALDRRLGAAHDHWQHTIPLQLVDD
ncbi:hypothetical protein ACHHYP_10726 [Achlya hypogyna]|uniref:Uncharacterized protein n=1 Tax=Achlya hypogyna TaxID=1202772 RepID=A0A1V9ZHR0_ACHHY|nr:hypothetical protein ACHHYP_10726 [Achlya hypogyna]